MLYRQENLGFYQEAVFVHEDRVQVRSKLVLDLKAFAGKPVTLRLIQRVLLGPELAPGDAYWHNLRLE